MPDYPESVVIVEGSYCKVIAVPLVFEQMDRLDPRVRAGLVMWMRYLAESGTNGIPIQSFKSQDRIKLPGRKDGKEINLYAFKERQCRVYGAFVAIDGTNNFICSSCDEAKKKRLANPELYKVAAKRISLFIKP